MHTTENYNRRNNRHVLVKKVYVDKKLTASAQIAVKEMTQPLNFSLNAQIDVAASKESKAVVLADNVSSRVSLVP
jgi:hypothetical protein